MNRFEKAALFLILLITVFCYAPALKSDFQFDDHRFIRDSRLIRDISRFSEISLFHEVISGGRPVTQLTFAINYAVDGFHPWGYHMVNLLIHLLNVVLVYIFMRLTVRLALGDEQNSWIALFVTALFAFHPVQTNAVTYIVQRAETLASVFYTASLLLLMRFALSSGLKSSVSVALAMPAFVLGWGNKEIIATAPVMFIIYAAFFFDRQTFRKSAVMALPFIAAVIAAGVFVLMKYSAGGDAGFGVTQIKPHEYFFTQARVLMTYMRLIVFPSDLNLDYDFEVARALSDSRVVFSLLFVAVLAALSFAAIWYRGRHQGPIKLMGFGFLWFLILLLPTSSFIPLKDVIFEHRIYLAMTGIALSVSAGLHLLRKSVKKKVPDAAVILLVAVVMVFGFLTYQRNLLWSDSVALWEDVARKSPQKARVRLNLGMAYFHAGLPDRALSEFAEGLRLSLPESETREQIIINIGGIYSDAGRCEEAVQLYEKALIDYPNSPGMLVNLSSCQITLGKPAEAALYAELALHRKPDFPLARNILGSAYLHLGRCEEALDQFRGIAHISAEEPGILWNTALSLICLGRTDEAEKYFTDYLKHEKDEGSKREAFGKWEQIRGEQ